MAHYTGYISVPHATYQQWRNATLGNGYNVDYAFGEQCWDYCALLYRQYGLTLITKAGGGSAKDCWNVSRWANSKPPFTSHTGKTNIRRGDILVFGAGTWGHIGFADENYNPSHPNQIWLLGQNQVGNGSGYPVTRALWSLNGFLGIFRNSNWQTTPPPTPPTPVVYNKGKYNFVLYNRRKRQDKWTRKPLKQN